MVNITLFAGGARTKVDESEAKEMANRFETEMKNDDNDNVVTMIDLSCRAWPLPSLECLRSVLEAAAPTVVHLKIDDIIASLPTEEGLESLAFFANVFQSSKVLSEINLDDNALGSRGDQVLLPLFKLDSLQILTIENCGMSEEVTASLLTTISKKPLTSIKLGRNQIGDEGASHVKTLLEQCPTLQCFHYNGCRPLKKGTSHILQGLATMASSLKETALTELNFHDCTFGDDEDGDDEEEGSIANLVAVLSKSPNLKVLNLQDGELGAEGLQLILNALAECQAPLTRLYLGGCELGEEGAEILANTFNDGGSLGQQLQELVLDTNEFGNDGIAALIPSLAKNAKSLLLLDLETNEIEKEGALILSQNKNKIPSLQTLNVSDNMDIPAQLGAKLAKMYPTVKIDEDLEEDDDLELEDDEDQGVDELANQLAGTNI
eukprot:CAMPEP_0198147188 /NCGR_PEP_ID=MMETSP1443-20131203/33704_1 /TAXON_ID=186043 /ORGANISM="Entomoneis sp., Strain CCMP2396" /LENGTH=434 /DNA_ID=CAMNT_0043811387 /DNA_START=95 /DNA_END=1399 /DNA_ORIENTATION=+